MDKKDFENKLTRHFYVHSKKIIVLDNLYTDWLIDFSRIIDKPINSLVISYLTNSNLGNIDNKKFIFRFLQFLSFSRHYFTDEKDLF